MHKKGQIRLVISRYDQISSSRPLENSYWEATRGIGSYGDGLSCEIEIENKLFVKGTGELYVASDALVEWYERSFYNSQAEDIVIIIDDEKKYARLETDPERPDREPPGPDDIPKAYIPPPEERRKLHKQIREQTTELSTLLDELENLQDDQPIKMNKAEISLVRKVADIAKLSKALFEPEK